MRPKISTQKTHNQARHLRRNLTEAETRLWAHLRTHQILDTHFRRQYAIGKYIVDFCAIREKLIIELDGNQHLDYEKDDGRSALLTSKGYRIFRFWNRDVIFELDGVIKAIEFALLENKNKE
jgi:very-short-patch-repair endonuclease